LAFIEYSDRFDQKVSIFLNKSINDPRPVIGAGAVIINASGSDTLPKRFSEVRQMP
jgi:hypothetical protein